MAKRLTKYMIGIAIVLIFVFFITKQHFSYDNVMKNNWGIQIPQHYHELYHFSPQSFHGDGIKYSVLQYDRDISKSFHFKPINSQHEVIIYDLLEQTEQKTPKEFYPSCFNQMIYIQKEELDTLYIIYDSSDFKLYIIENYI